MGILVLMGRVGIMRVGILRRPNVGCVSRRITKMNRLKTVGCSGRLEMINRPKFGAWRVIHLHVIATCSGFR